MHQNSNQAFDKADSISRSMRGEAFAESFTSMARKPGSTDGKLHIAQQIFSFEDSAKFGSANLSVTSSSKL
jgi:hypothetical protein